MPNAFIKEISKQTGIYEEKLEREYNQQEKLAKKRKAKNPYAYATYVVEKMHPNYTPKYK